MWKYIHISTLEEIRLSGWKVYIYGESIEDSNYIENSIYATCNVFNVTTKLATNDIILRNTKIKPAWGIAVIYLHSELFQLNLVDKLIKELSSCISDYKKSGYYKGAKPISDKLSIRYDLSIPTIDIEYEQYLNYYRGEFGSFNIPNNQIPKQLIINQL